MKSLLFILTFVTILSACDGPQQEDKTGKEGKPMPNFSLRLADSTSFLNTGTIPNGQKAALFIYSPHCPYCRNQLKDIIENMDRLKDINFYLITNFPYHDMKKFYDEFQLNKYPNIVTGQDTAFFATNYFEAIGVPYTAIYNKDKKLSKAYSGPIHPKQIIEAAAAN